jgi:hypothetical protein
LEVSLLPRLGSRADLIRGCHLVPTVYSRVIKMNPPTLNLL